MPANVIRTLAALTVVAMVSWVAAEDRKPPSITYGPSRSSDKWIETANGKVAVDQGIEWEGTRLYLSLLWDLIAVDAKTEKVLWHERTSAFWNTLSIKEVEVEQGKKAWVVALQPREGNRRGAEQIEYRDLQTGKKIVVPGSEAKPSGIAFKPREVLSGKDAALAQAYWTIVTTKENWDKVSAKLFGNDNGGAALKDLNFAKEVVLVVAAGDSSNCNGFGCSEAYEDDQRILIRLQAQTFQTIGGSVPTRPYGLFVLPRSEAKAYVVERNTQRYIGGPPLWKESQRTDKLPEAAKQIEGLSKP